MTDGSTDERKNNVAPAHVNYNTGGKPRNEMVLT